MSQRSRVLVRSLAFLSFLAVGTLLADDFLPHTDDGCSVEVHCLACRLSIGTSVLKTNIVGDHKICVAAERVASPAAQPLAEAHRSGKTSRGPPAVL